MVCLVGGHSPEFHCSTIREVFDRARKAYPSAIVMDCVDMFASCDRYAVTELLVQMNKSSAQEPFVFCLTTKPWNVVQALLRR